LGRLVDEASRPLCFHMSATIRLASENDAAAIRAIYGPFCDSTIVSFESSAPSVPEMAARISKISEHFPWLILEDEGVVAGYAYASRHHERAAYMWSVDSAVYVDPRYQRRGVGRALYTTLFELLQCQGFFKVFAAISLPNPASTGMHEAFGFQLAGVTRGVGYKFGGWHDVAHYQLALQPERTDPEPPSPPSALIREKVWTDAVSRGLRHFKPNV
jgi:L-amino acid N-acyltransferase YncA